MQPCNATTLSEMAQHLQAATAARDWTLMARLDGQLHACLGHPGARDAALHPAWLALREAHREALQACREAKAEAAQRLLLLQRIREAQQAYAWQEILG